MFDESRGGLSIEEEIAELLKTQKLYNESLKEIKELKKRISELESALSLIRSVGCR